MSGEPPKKDVINYQFKANDWAIGERAARKPRKPSLKRAVKAAEAAIGAKVSALTLPDGTRLEFSEPTADSPAVNPWLLDREGKARR